LITHKAEDAHAATDIKNYLIVNGHLEISLKTSRTTEEEFPDTSTY
jgi:hypothetical protein